MPTYSTNKKAYFDYEILDTLEAGLVLEGHEVKAIRAGQAKLTGSFVTFHKGNPMVTNMHIGQYKYASNIKNYVPDRPRNLLLKAKEIAYLQAKSAEKGLTIVPLSVYTKGRKIKLSIGVAKGKKNFDKRASIKKKEQRREDARLRKSTYRLS